MDERGKGKERESNQTRPKEKRTKGKEVRKEEGKVKKRENVSI